MNRRAFLRSVCAAAVVGLVGPLLPKKGWGVVAGGGPDTFSLAVLDDIMREIKTFKPRIAPGVDGRYHFYSTDWHDSSVWHDLLDRRRDREKLELISPRRSRPWPLR